MKKVVLNKNNIHVDSVPGVPNVGIIRRDYHEPLPVGTVVAMMFVIEGYDLAGRQLGCL